MRDYLAHAFADAHRIELRHHCGERWLSGIFDNAHDLVDAAQPLVGNVYTSLNAPAQNVAVTNALNGRALVDADIASVVRLPFDFDPVRPRHVPSTEVELADACAQRNRFRAAMSGLGWPAPASATSGNGAHAVYRCRLPNDAATREMFTALYRGLAVEFTTDAVVFDATVRNASRIWRCYGTLNSKGQATPERPHRRAAVVVPDRWEGVAPRLIERLANKYARRQKMDSPPAAAPRTLGRVGAGDFASLDVVSWFAAHDAYKRALGSGKHAVECPWSEQHSTASTPASTDSVVWEGEAGHWPQFFCSHAHCDVRRIGDVLCLWGDADAFCARLYRRSA